MRLGSYSSRASAQHSRRAPARRSSSSLAGGSSTFISSNLPLGSPPTSPPARATKAISAQSEGRACDNLEPPQSGRRLALIHGALVVVAAAALPTAARAADDDAVRPTTTTPPTTTAAAKHPRVYLDVRVDGEPAGRIEIELLPEFAPVAARRFADLAEEVGGVGYKSSKWDGIFLEKGYVRCAGARSLSYGADGISGIAGGGSTLDLEREMDEQERRRQEAAAASGGSTAALAHDRAGVVSLVVRESQGARPVKERLVAVGGKLVTLASQAGEAPNGSAFCVTLAPAPSLDSTNVIVGRLVPDSAGSAATVAALAALPVNMPRAGISKPFFEAGKAMGDSRAIVAEKGFYRPLRRAIISGGGELPT